jgi:hypothetical protein
MKKKPCKSVYLALLFLIFLVLVFPYKEGFDSTVTTTTNGNTITTSYNFFDYYWPFSDKFLQLPSSSDDPHKWLNSENGGSSSSNTNRQSDTNIDTRTNNTAGYNDVDYRGFNTAGTGNDGTRYKSSV